MRLPLARTPRRRVLAWAGLGLLVSFPLGLLLGTLVSAPRAHDPGREAVAAHRTAGALAAAAPAAGSSTTAEPTAAAQDVPAGSRRLTPIVEAARRVTPSVVSVTVLRRERVVARSLFDIFVPRGFERLVQGIGSGFAMDREGHVLTNHHVVRDADSIVVADARGRVYRARILGSDELTDLAVLKIEPDRVPPAPLGTSSDLMVGEPAVAIGNPFAYLLANSEATVTSGVISGVGRNIRSEATGEVLYADMVQTDASINPGNSGGPLVNADGEVAGVNSSIFSRSGGSEGLGFAIPIDRALRVAGELRRFGRIRRPWVGVDVIAAESDTVRGQTAVERVAPGSPAEAAGLQAGDVLVSLGGRPIVSPLDWEVGLLDAGVGAEAEVRFRRDGRERSARLRIQEVPSELAERVEVFRGLELISVTPQIAAERRLAVDQGAMIISIEPRASRLTGMRVGDVIVAINRNPVDGTERATELFRYYAGRGYITIVFYRGRTAYSTTFRLL